MANTFKFGNGNWAVKDGYALAYNDENNNFKPLPFDFTRASSATRVNKQGLIETVGSGKPRIDFLDNTSGHLLLEPSRSNKIAYSEGFNNWASVFTSVSLNEIVSPDGSVNATKLTDTSDSSTHRIQLGNTTSSSGSFCYSIFLKKGTLTTVALSVYSGANAADSKFDLNNGSIISTTNGTAEIQEYGNDWYRCIVKGTLASTSTTTYIYLKEKASYSGSSQFLYAWGGQLEEGSYATSYIPTEGSSVTRVAETANGAGNSTVFNDSEGVLFVETEQFVDGDFTSVYISLRNSSDSGFTNALAIQHRNSGQLRIYADGSGTPDIQFLVNIDLKQNLKIAVQYKQNNYKLFVNGVEYSIYGSGGSQPALSGLNTVNFNLEGSTNSNWLGKVKDLKVYNTALTDTELQNLTS